ncbi:hypothetical protein K1T71_011147 [Dendrolimus kikuchii]|uniref:Uncharacterized protein n=1 Tax=Dendrolimus kikuchii TaxID=765133 RepID=A0ACC1CNE7_9NEOP|nr:hypothetical protein K1T71_011147 [Dendrolimus kikuchii]
MAVLSYIEVAVLYFIIIIHVFCIRTMPSPIRVTIDCSDEKPSRPWVSKSRQFEQRQGNMNMNSFCNLIHSALPKAVKNGRFILIEPDQDQTGLGDTISPIAIAPPKEFLTRTGIHRFKQPKLKIPRINVPTLRPRDMSPLAPRIASPMYVPSSRYSEEEESSVERMEIFKKGVQKLLHFVKVLGKIDQYLSERTRIIIEKLSKTFSD